MRCLIRNVTRTGKGSIIHQGKECDGERVTLGRAVDQDIFLSDLRAALHHARISKTGDGRFLLLSRVPSGVHHNGEVVQFAYLEDGDRIGIGSYEITVIVPKEDYDLILDVERQSTARGKEFREALAARSGMGMAAAGIHPRRWSWALFLIILVVFLALPLAGFYYQPLQDVQRSTPLPGDGTWDVGKLASGHHAFGLDCNQCHRKAFIPVRDGTCLECHRNQPDHVNPAVFDAAAETRCTTCHQDHNGPRGLILSNPALCTDCHGRIAQVLADTEIGNVENFSKQHPQFRVSLLGEGQPVRVSMDETLIERSNLKFPHDKHLDSQGIRSPRGKIVLECASCHVPQPGGARMQPIDFERHCHDCHKLAFETEDEFPFELPPEALREVPHGNVNAVLQALESFYALSALEGGYEDPDAPEVVRRRRRPGEVLGDAERVAALEWARERAAQTGAELFEYRTCATCHSVTQPEASVFGWRITPVRLAEHWFPKAYFTHGKHKTMTCTHCHRAEQSDTSSDVLMPGINECRMCHADPGARARLESTCITCHNFHLFDQAGPLEQARADE